MAVKDDPKSRIKAADAKSGWHAWSAGPDAFALWSRNFAVTHKLKAWTAWAFTGGGREPGRHSWAWGEGGAAVITHWGDGIPAGSEVTSERGFVILVVLDNGDVEIATHGVTGRACRALGAWGGGILDKISVAPFQTWFGWGHGGAPTKIYDDSLAALTPAQQDYVRFATHSEAE